MLTFPNGLRTQCVGRGFNNNIYIYMFSICKTMEVK